MEVLVIEAEAYKNLINQFTEMKEFMQKLTDQMYANTKPYLSVTEVCALTGFGKTWVNDNKADIGFSSVGGAIRFKRNDVTEYMEANYFKSKIRRSNI
ncbi:MAG: helix-turn-helix domain-containing protein [Pedobacter sp.]|nr:helix-turn-helix domain-containing protein [Pedobacter sp.]